MHTHSVDLVEVSICFDFNWTGRTGVGSARALQGSWTLKWII